MVCGSIAYEHYEKDTIRLGKIMFCYEGGCGRRSTQIRNMLMRLKKGNGSEGKKNELSRSLCRTKLTSSRRTKKSRQRNERKKDNSPSCSFNFATG